LIERAVARSRRDIAAVFLRVGCGSGAELGRGEQHFATVADLVLCRVHGIGENVEVRLAELAFRNRQRHRAPALRARQYQRVLGLSKRLPDLVAVDAADALFAVRASPRYACWKFCPVIVPVRGRSLSDVVLDCSGSEVAGLIDVGNANRGGKRLVLGGDESAGCSDPANRIERIGIGLVLGCIERFDASLSDLVDRRSNDIASLIERGLIHRPAPIGVTACDHVAGTEHAGHSVLGLLEATAEHFANRQGNTQRPKPLNSGINDAANDRRGDPWRQPNRRNSQAG
jgi:hypothetical protein